jgi:antirestriction protein ArdC
MNNAAAQSGISQTASEEVTQAEQAIGLHLTGAAFGNEPAKHREPVTSASPIGGTKCQPLETVTLDMTKKEDVMRCVDNALNDLESALAQGHSEGLKHYLKIMSQFHNYSFRNMLLILQQNPDATFVAGFRKWKTMGRSVCKGQRGIRILAPSVRKKSTDEKGEKPEGKEQDQPKKIITGFRLASVFDVSQTDGQELPDIGGYSGDPAENLQRLESFIASKEIELVMENPDGGALGVSEKGLIRVRPDLSPADTFAVMAHEVAHELLHKGPRRAETTASIRETEAEAVAYAACCAVGLEAHSRASDYIQLHQGDTEKFQQSLDHIRKTASEILGALELKPSAKDKAV